MRLSKMVLLLGTVCSLSTGGYAVGGEKGERFPSDESVKLKYTKNQKVNITEDKEKIIFEMHKQKAEQGDLESQCELANCYHNGIGVVKSLEEALYWYYEAAKKNNPQGLYMVGLYYDLGWAGLEKSEEVAFLYYTKAAKEGHHEGKFKIFQKYGKDFYISFEKSLKENEDKNSQEQNKNNQ